MAEDEAGVAEDEAVMEGAAGSFHTDAGGLTLVDVVEAEEDEDTEADEEADSSASSAGCTDL